MSTIELSLEKINLYILSYARSISSQIQEICMTTDESDEIILCKPLLSDLHDMSKYICNLPELGKLYQESHEN